jgi:hypothetical protein
MMNRELVEPISFDYFPIIPRFRIDGSTGLIIGLHNPPTLW